MSMLANPPDWLRVAILLTGASRIEKGVQGILLPGSPGGRWNPLLLPGGVRPRFCPNNY